MADSLVYATARRFGANLVTADAQSGLTMSWIANDLGQQRRFTESEQWFLRAEPLVRQSYVVWHYPRHLTYRSIVERVKGNLWHRSWGGRPASEYGDYVRGRGPEAWPTPPPAGARVGYAPAGG